jgi:hypothetical protein
VSKPAQQATVSRLALAFLLGALVWIPYKCLWALWRFSSASAETSTSQIGIWATLAVGQVAEFATYFGIGCLLWFALRRRPRNGWVLAALLAALIYYLTNAAAVFFLDAYLLPADLSWRTLVPGSEMILHMIAAACVGALIWRVTYRRVVAPSAPDVFS